MKLTLLSAAILCFQVSCATRITPSNYEQLPEKTTTPYTGSRYPTTLLPWIYFGSNERGHHFRYTWLRGNSVFDKKIITGESAPIDKPFPLNDDPSEWQSAEPVIGSDSKLKGFRTTPFYQDFRKPNLPWTLEITGEQ